MNLRRWATNSTNLHEAWKRVKCLICRRFEVRPGSQITAPLPEDRIKAKFPFETVGIDFADTIYIKNDEKEYVALFTCAVTRAIHLEVVSSLSTEHFLLAFRRFIARRGICHTVNSDNTMTFKSADNELKRLYMNICEPEVQNYFGKKEYLLQLESANLNKNVNVNTEFNVNDIVFIGYEKVP
ncbi:uncharacterized protein TNCT_517001 [Trichonephila clavata]|uniref:Integrase catalytic domain-containing protein n=1 Tax=Trichonephila clavata TaxID=2740835 RepID=A0A8X6GQK5_TRICU|nr:uncharacterized protein TNCT_517001 [Trichonephila clavata]